MASSTLDSERLFQALAANDGPGLLQLYGGAAVQALVRSSLEQQDSTDSTSTARGACV